jgi:NAD-dependent dihydropyrimidine dehydrogenase PreA subunit
MKNLQEYHGNYREKIPWHPTINYEKCVNCGVCVEYCKLGVYSKSDEDGEEKPVVSNPNNCVVFCTGCESQCPQGAISFPSKQETRDIIKKLRSEEKTI